jgi:AcrR family transcriptional regulator
VARRLYFAGGPDGVTARKIAAGVGLSATALYLHYDGIDDVLHTLRMEGHDRLDRYLREAPAGAPAIEQARSMGRAYFRFGIENPRYFELMYLVRASERARRAAVQREMHTLMLVRDVVVRGMESGGIRRDLDPMVVTTILWAKIHGLTQLAVAGLLVDAMPVGPEGVLEVMLDSIAVWLQAGAAAPRSEVNTVHPRSTARRRRRGGVA